MATSTDREAVLRRLWKSDVPEGVSGAWAVERFMIRRDPPPKERLEALPGDTEYAPSKRGTYTRLNHRGTVFMTDTQDEWVSHREVILQAAHRGGRVLVNGLGLGLVVEVMLRNPYRPVEHLTVIECSEDVIRLVGRHLASRYGDRLEIVLADAFAWQPPPGRRYSVVWHDLWPHPHPDNFPEMDRLEQRYDGLCDWQASWARAYAESYFNTLS